MHQHADQITIHRKFTSQSAQLSYTMPTKVVFHSEQVAQEFWAAQEAKPDSSKKHSTFATDEFDDDDEYFSVASHQSFPNDIPEFITIDLNDNLVGIPKPRRSLKRTLKRTREALRKVAAKSRAAKKTPDQQWWFSNSEKSRKCALTSGNDGIDLPNTVGSLCGNVGSIP